MKAMIFAAGMGTRLYPLTKNKPKALVEIDGKPMLEWQILKLKNFGIKEVVINVHHFGDQIINFLRNRNNFGLNIHISDESDELLDTGGGLKKAGKFLHGDEPFILQNVDVFTDLQYKDLVDAHYKTNAIATIAVKKRHTSRYLLFDCDNVLCGWINKRTGEEIITRDESNLLNYAFSGIHIINPEIFNLITEEGNFSIIKLYLRLSKFEKINACIHNDSVWYDVGKVNEFKDFEKNYLRISR